MCRGFPTDFPVVGCDHGGDLRLQGRGFPTDFPVVGSRLFVGSRWRGRGFPTDFPVVGYLPRFDNGLGLAVASLPISPW